MLYWQQHLNTTFELEELNEENSAVNRGSREQHPNIPEETARVVNSANTFLLACKSLVVGLGFKESKTIRHKPLWELAEVMFQIILFLFQSVLGT